MEVNISIPTVIHTIILILFAILDLTLKSSDGPKQFQFGLKSIFFKLIDQGRMGNPQRSGRFAFAATALQNLFDQAAFIVCHGRLEIE